MRKEKPGKPEFRSHKSPRNAPFTKDRQYTSRTGLMPFFFSKRRGHQCLAAPVESRVFGRRHSIRLITISHKFRRFHSSRTPLMPSPFFKKGRVGWGLCHPRVSAEPGLLISGNFRCSRTFWSHDCVATQFCGPDFPHPTFRPLGRGRGHQSLAAPVESRVTRL